MQINKKINMKIKSRHNADLYLYYIEENDELYDKIDNEMSIIGHMIHPLKIKYYIDEDNKTYLVVELIKNENN